MTSRVTTRGRQGEIRRSATWSTEPLEDLTERFNSTLTLFLSGEVRRAADRVAGQKNTVISTLNCGFLLSSVDLSFVRL